MMGRECNNARVSVTRNTDATEQIKFVSTDRCVVDYIPPSLCLTTAVTSSDKKWHHYDAVSSSRTLADETCRKRDDYFHSTVSENKQIFSCAPSQVSNI